MSVENGGTAERSKATHLPLRRTNAALAAVIGSAKGVLPRATADRQRLAIRANPQNSHATVRGQFQVATVTVDRSIGHHIEAAPHAPDRSPDEIRQRLHGVHS